MKKILLIACIIAFGNSVFAGSYLDKQIKETKKNKQYQTVQFHTKTHSDINFTKSDTIKDPQLIKLSDFTPIDENLYKKKIDKDEEKYNKEIYPILNKKSMSLEAEPYTIDFYNLYRITEKIIRANNLEHMNWRIAVRKTTEDINAYATSGNLIAIHTALYDSLYNNEDALALIIGHEMAHTILGHNQRLTNLHVKINNILKTYQVAGKNVDYAGILAISDAVYIKKLNNEVNMLEYMADSEGLKLITKAGYSPQKALYGLDFLESLPEVKQLYPSHPLTKDRIASAKENISVANCDWAEEGKVNIFNSNVLPVKKSSDRVSFVINSDESIQNHYTPETTEEYITRVAYMSYINGKMENAVKYFGKLTKIDENNYIPYVYSSYANLYLYNVTKDAKYQKRAVKDAERASILNNSNDSVKALLKEVKK